MKSSEVVLIVEQQSLHLLQVDQAFRKQGVDNPVHVLRSKDEACCYLNGIGIYADRQRYPLPGIIVIDLDLPGGSGFELIRWIRTEKKLKNLPIVATDGSSTPERTRDAYNRGANAYYRKPIDFQELAELVQELELIDEVRDKKKNTKADPYV